MNKKELQSRNDFLVSELVRLRENYIKLYDKAFSERMTKISFMICGEKQMRKQSELVGY